eukprot:m.107383 g.107383  ORF g.107383 m.107383 type:complete len:369 (+) comp51700_c0_seq15:257-1363(+)
MFIIRRVFRLRVADRAYCCKTCAFPVAWRMHQGRLCFRAQSRALCSAAAHHPSHCTAAGQTEAAANTANAGHRASESGCIAPAAAVTAAAVTATATGARRSTATVASSAVRIRSGASPAPLQPFLSKTLVRLAHSQLPPTFVVLLPRLKQPQIPRLQPAKMSQATAASRLSARLGTPASASGVQLAAPNHPVWQIANDLREQLQAEAQSAATAPGRKRHQEARPPLVHNEAALKASLEKAKTPATKPPSQPLSSSTKASVRCRLDCSGVFLVTSEQQYPKLSSRFAGAFADGAPEAWGLVVCGNPRAETTKGSTGSISTSSSACSCHIHACAFGRSCCGSQKVCGPAASCKKIRRWPVETLSLSQRRD